MTPARHAAPVPLGTGRTLERPDFRSRTGPERQAASRSPSRARVRQSRDSRPDRDPHGLRAISPPLAEARLDGSSALTQEAMPFGGESSDRVIQDRSRGVQAYEGRLYVHSCFTQVVRFLGASLEVPFDIHPRSDVVSCRICQQLCGFPLQLRQHKYSREATGRWARARVLSAAISCQRGLDGGRGDTPPHVAGQGAPRVHGDSRRRFGGANGFCVWKPTHCGRDGRTDLAALAAQKTAGRAARPGY